MASNEATNKPGPFDMQTIKALVALMSRHDLAEIDLRQGEQRIRLRRGPHGVTVASVPPPVPQTPPPPPAPTTVSAPSPTADKPARALHEIKSPSPGVFYVAPEPDAEPYVKIGSRVTPSTVIGIVMAMKVQNEIQAECTGVIVEVLVGNDEPVEYGTVLFRVDPTA